MKKYLFILFIILISCKTKQVTSSKFLEKSFENIKIYEQQNALEYGPCEPSIFINPLNTSNLVAGSVMKNEHRSFDGGKTWKTNTLKSSLGVYGDPCIAADFKGNFYYFHLANPDGMAYSGKRFLESMVVQKSVDGGKTWSDGTAIGKNDYPRQQDKEWAVVNPKNNEIYLTWTEFEKYGSKDKNHHSRIRFSKSTDDAKIWSKAITLSEIEGDALDDDLTVEGAVPAIGAKGEIYVSWSVNNKIYFDKSLDDGKTWLKNDIEVCNQPKGWTFDVDGVSRANGMPITCVDTSNSKYKGTIYINFSDQRNGEDNTDIFLVKSTDDGKTWSHPVKVNIENTKTHQFFTWMSVDAKTGYIYIVFYDRSKYTNNQTDVMLAVSKDGGETFVNKTISSSPFTPIKSVFFGDYNNISAYDGIIRPIWTRYENGKLSIWTCLIEDK